MPTVNIARALKVKNRLTSRIKELIDFINKSNSVVVGAERAGSVKAAYDEVVQKTETLAEVKAAIQIANQPVQLKIFQLSELRSRKTFLQRLVTTQGTSAIGYSGEVGEYDAELTGAYVAEEVKAVTKRLESIQDELDEFNAKTQIEIPEIGE